MTVTVTDKDSDPDPDPLQKLEHILLELRNAPDSWPQHDGKTACPDNISTLVWSTGSEDGAKPLLEVVSDDLFLCKELPALSALLWAPAPPTSGNRVAQGAPSSSSMWLPRHTDLRLSNTRPRAARQRRPMRSSCDS